MPARASAALAALATTLAILSSLLSSFAVPANASPLLTHNVQDLAANPEDSLLYPRQRPSSFFSVTGIQGLGAPPRLEIRELEKNRDQWNLYILGLDSFMKSNQSEKLSYYQIAGLHGRPYIPWDNVGPYPNTSSGPGYCTHVSNIFLPWHRPYLALYEQVLYSHIIGVVNTFPAGSVRTRYARAALTWRHPFWDWAAPQPNGASVYPASLTTPTINVTLPNGTATIPNPLFAYNFHPVSVSDFFYNPFATWRETKRYPTGWTSDAPSQNNLIGPICDNNRQSFADRLYNLYTNYHNFTEFGNEAWYYGSGVQNADSIESLHDAIHGITGSSGHMTYLDYSAFDPIFWLHHAMIDRLFALFQALNPNTYVEPMPALEQTYTIWPGKLLDANTPLDPFHRNAAGDMHTSNGVRDLKTLGYTYPELNGNVSAASVRAAINRLYGSTGGSGVLSRRSSQQDDIPTKRAINLNSADLDSTPGESTEYGKMKEYILNIQSQKFALDGSYAIYVFLGYFNQDDPSSWALAPNLVGTHVVFAALPSDPQGDGLPRKRAMSDLLVTGTMPLTSMLLAKVKAGELNAMDDQSVEDYLSKNLIWRAAMFDNTVVPIEGVSGLDVTVVRAEVEPASSADSFPVWGNFVTLKHLTQSSGQCAV